MYKLFNNKEGKFIYLTNYKQFFKIDDLAYDLLSREENTKEKEDMLNRLEKTLKEVDSYTVKEIKKKRFGLFLCVANTCNAKCKYCFAGQGNYGKENGLMSYETAVKAIDFFMDNIPSDGIANIIFFGGEPTLTFSLIEKSVDYVEKRYSLINYKFHLVTNATLLTKNMIDFLSKHNFSVGVSIDGDPEVQNKQRPLRNGKDSYEEATKNLSYLLDNVSYVHARGTYSNFDESLVKAYKHLLDIGFKEVNIPPDILNSDQNKNFDKMLEQLDELYDFIVSYSKEHKDFPFGVFYEEIRRIFMPKLDIDYSCGVGESIFSVDIKGDIYPCHRFSSEKDFVLKNLYKEEDIKKIKYVSYDCCNCWNKYTCSHGCFYNDYSLNKSFEKNPFWCRYSKKMTELSLLLITKLSDNQLRQILSV